MKQNWIFLRGLGRDSFHWGHFSKELTSTYPHVDIELIDLDGTGKNFNTLTPMLPREVIEKLRANSRILQKGEKINLLGISLGGMIALKWAELFPKEIESITVINSSLSQLSPFHERLNLKEFKKILAAFMTNSQSTREKIILDISSNQSKIKNLVLEQYIEHAQQFPFRKINYIRQVFLANRITVDSLPLVPLNIIASKNDHLVPYEASVKIALKFNGNLFTHQTAGHDLPLDDPEWLREILAKC
jgi:pimeloyl-ACP methyl ester carboxylesterase